MSINDWPAAERPREKLISLGAQALSDAELLAIFLRTGLPGITAVDLARDLLQSFGGLRPVFESDYKTFCQYPGLGAAKYAQLQAVLEMARRHFGEALQKGIEINSPEVTRQYIMAKLRGYKKEVFACLYLDTKHRLIHYCEHFFGTIDGATVHPREIVKTALEQDAAAVVLAHNHPSGSTEPSEADKAITLRLSQALALVDVRVLDHMVVGDCEVLSFSEQGLI